MNLKVTKPYSTTSRTLEYTYSYKLSTDNDELGFPIHSKFRNYRKSYSFAEASKKTDSDIAEYLSSTAYDVTYSVIEGDSRIKATFYVMPMLFKIEVEGTEPIITWKRVDESEKVVCVQGKSGGILFTLKNAKKEWLKLDGYLEFTDAMKDWKVTHKVQYNESSLYATRTNCIEYVPKKINAYFIPDPSKPNEKYCSEFERPENDLGKNVSYPTPNTNHTVKVDLGNLGSMNVEKPTVDVVVSEKDTPFVKETITVDTTLKGSGTVILSLSNIKPTTNTITVYANIYF